MSSRSLVIPVAMVVGFVPAFGDDLSYQYEADVVPYDAFAGWSLYNPCEYPCSESLADGHFVLQWPEANDLANYAYRIAEPPEDPPPTLWVEWRFRSNHPLGANFDSCDGGFTVKYGGMLEVVFMYGDAAISFSGGDVVTGLDINEFHTYRFESLDGINYWIAVDGLVFIVDADDNPNGYHYLQLFGAGGCNSDQIPDMVNEWDFVRFGTISYGEQIIATDPPAGYLSPQQYPSVDRFTVTFDSPNFVYLDEITVEVTGGVAPVVTQVWRLDNDEPDTIEIVLDTPLPMDELTRFIFDDGQIVNVVEYSYATIDEGACCRGDGSCVDLTADGCAAIPGAEYRGDSTTCRGDNNANGFDDACDSLFVVPAVSEWSVVVLTLLVLTSATLILRRQPRPGQPFA